MKLKINFFKRYLSFGRLLISPTRHIGQFEETFRQQQLFVRKRKADTRKCLNDIKVIYEKKTTHTMQTILLYIRVVLVFV